VSAAVDGTARRARLARSRLYLVLEGRPHGQDPSDLLDAALRGGVDIVQLRDKDLSDEDLVVAAAPFRRACDEHGALFVLNDRPDLVERCGADGVHVGQTDASVTDARNTVGVERLVGLSVTTPEELEAAEHADADYLGVGAVYSTPTKEEAGAGGLELVRAATEGLRVPWFAIGGIELDTLSAVVEAGAPGVAVVRAIRDAGDPGQAARALRAVLIRIEIDERTLGPGEVGARAAVDAGHAVAVYVVEGELELRLHDTTARVPSGSCVAAPPGLLHGFRNPADVPARFVRIRVPGHGRREPHAVVSGPGDGDRLVRPHRFALVKAELPELVVLEYAVDGDYDGADAHFHALHAESVHVVQGELELQVAGETVRLRAGRSLTVPPGVVHAFTNSGPGVARFLTVHAPDSGVVAYVRARDAGEEPNGPRHDVHQIVADSERRS
jgi:thiamine-phosphate pyrophosphorylase